MCPRCSSPTRPQRSRSHFQPPKTPTLDGPLWQGDGSHTSRHPAVAQLCTSEKAMNSIRPSPRHHLNQFRSRPPPRTLNSSPQSSGRCRRLNRSASAAKWVISFCGRPIELEQPFARSPAVARALSCASGPCLRVGPNGPRVDPFPSSCPLNH